MFGLFLSFCVCKPRYEAELNISQEAYGAYAQ